MVILEVPEFFDENRLAAHQQAKMLLKIRDEFLTFTPPKPLATDFMTSFSPAAQSLMHPAR